MNLSDLIAAHAAAEPSRIALIFRDEKITYGELNDRVLRCAQGLWDRGVRKGTTFALLLRNSPEYIILSVALGRIGAITVPINFLEKPDRVALILNDAKAEGILSSKEFYRSAATAAKQVPTLKHFYLKDGSHKEFHSFTDLLAGSAWTGGPVVSDTDLMMLLYTSGTTGLPKGVMLSHKNFVSNVEQCLGAIRLVPKDRFVCVLPMFHAFAWTTCVMIPMKLGASVVVIETLLPFDPVIKAIWKHKATLFVAVPQIFGALVAKVDGVKALVLRFLNPVRICISGAAPLPMGVLTSFQKKFGVKLLEGYGLTEAAPVVTLNREKNVKPGTVGSALPGVEVELRDDDGKSVPHGEVGEIWVRGANVMSGYYNKPEETQAVLTSDGWLKTGDMGRLDNDNYITIVDRKKDLIIIKGLNVYPGEVENVILQDDSVKEVAVVGKFDKETGEELIRAFVTVKEGRGIDKTALFALCKEKLAPYKRPREIILLDEMPKNALQKILKKDLRNRP